jgi:probable selenium-dependent hydroxylase accessory protein YqeC
LSKILCGQDNDFFVQTVTTRHTAFLCYYFTDAKEVVTLETPSNKKDAAAVLFESLGLAKHKVISITGGGGKTSLMSALGRHSSRDAFTLITTTTKIFPPQDGSPAATIAEAKDLINALSAIGPSASMVTAAKEKVGEKLCGYSPEEIAEIASGSPIGRIIVEADGSRGLSLKAYQAWEPPVPAVADCHFIVVGADIFISPLSPANTFRFDIIKEKFSLEPGELISFANCAALLSDKAEYLKNSPEHAMRILFINKCDLLTDDMMAEISERLSALLKGYDHLAMGSMKDDAIYLTKELKR